MTQQGYPPPANSSPLSNLSVIQRISETYKLWHGTLTIMPRMSRYTIGTRIDKLFLDIIELIIKAAYAPREKKQLFIVEATKTVDVLQLFLKIAWEMKLVENDKYLVISSPLVEVGKMLGGWKKQLDTTQTPAS